MLKLCVVYRVMDYNLIFSWQYYIEEKYEIGVFYELFVL